MLSTLRSKLSISVLLVLLLPIMLAACRPSAKVPSRVAFTVEETGTIVSAPATKDFGITGDCVIGLVLVGPKNDHGWSEAHYEAANRVAADSGCRLITFENLNDAASPGTTLLDVATTMVDQGADLIVASGDAFEQDSTKVAQKFPNVAVLQISGSNRLVGKAPDNLANSHSMAEASYYVAGCTAVRRSYSIQGRNGKIFVGLIGPLINPETRREVSSAYIGARSCASKLGLNPEKQLTFEVVWIGFWFNIPGVTLDPTEVSHDFFDRGAQVVMSGIDTTEAIQVASSRRNRGENVWAIGIDSIHACDLGENACLGEQFYDWSQTYRDQIDALKKHEWTARWVLRAPNWQQFGSTAVGATPIGFDFSRLSSDEKTFVQQVIDDLAADSRRNPGMIPGWRGPLNLQDGTVFAPEGQAADPFDVWFLPQLVSGVVGGSASK